MSFPVPVREDVESFHVLVPVTAVEVIAVFGQSGKVDDTEQGRVAGPVGVVRCRFTQIIEASPYKFPDAVGEVFVLDKVVFGQVRPTAMLYVV